MVAARKGNIGSVVSAGPLLWVRAENRPVDAHHSGLAMARTNGVSNLLPPLAKGAHCEKGREWRNGENANFSGRSSVLCSISNGISRRRRPGKTP